MSRDFHHWFHPSYSLVLAACDVSVDHLKMPENNIQGAANKSNPLSCFVNISTTNGNF